MSTPADEQDLAMMWRCIALSKTSGEEGEYPYAAVICRAGEVVVESTNRVARDRDVTRHAEAVAVSAAQQALGRTSLDDCTIYVNAEPCAFCSYAIRESRIARVVYGLRSPHMGGLSKWNVLADADLSDRMPDVFAPPPEIVPGVLWQEAEEACMAWNPLIWEIVKRRGLFVGAPTPQERALLGKPRADRGPLWRMMGLLRRSVFDRFGRGR
jgi:tRNA(adenine34) deaminase